MVSPAAAGGAGSVRPAGDAVAAAELTGVVIGCETRVNSVTGKAFLVAPVRLDGWELTLCLAACEFAAAPSAGDVVSGSSFVVLSFPSLRAPRAARPAAAASPESERKRWRKR
jgi:hypothetical protein